MSAAKPAGLRVVLDSNVYISAFAFPEGPVFQLWRAARDRRYAAIVSPSIIAEVAESLRLDFSWDEKRIIDRVKLLVRVAELVAPKERLSVITDDPDDDRILECAVAGRADLIVSGDRHLRKVKAFRGIAIIRPIDFHRTLGLDS